MIKAQYRHSSEPRAFNQTLATKIQCFKFLITHHSGFLSRNAHITGDPDFLNWHDAPLESKSSLSDARTCQLFQSSRIEVSSVSACVDATYIFIASRADIHFDSSPFDPNWCTSRAYRGDELADNVRTANERAESTKKTLVTYKVSHHLPFGPKANCVGDCFHRLLVPSNEVPAEAMRMGFAFQARKHIHHSPLILITEIRSRFDYGK